MRSRTRFGLLAGLCLLLVSACNRTGEPHSSGDAQAAPPVQAPLSPPAQATATEKSAPSGPAKCIIPMPSEPPPRAPNALHCPPDPRTAASELASGYVVFTDAPGSPRLKIELARTEAEKALGLMYRTKLPDAQGMLFSWGGVEEPRTFWMHNTCIPLDMMFITRDGTIAGIVEQVPTLNDEPRGVPCSAAYVLEVNAGWSRAHGIQSGMMVHIE